jgi:hypothetical protein
MQWFGKPLQKLWERREYTGKILNIMNKDYKFNKSSILNSLNKWYLII